MLAYSAFNIHENGDFQRSNAVVRAVGVATAGLITVKASRIDSSVAGVFLGVSAEKRTPHLLGIRSTLMCSTLLMKSHLAILRCVEKIENTRLSSSDG